MGLLLIKPAELLLFSTGADNQKNPRCSTAFAMIPFRKRYASSPHGSLEQVQQTYLLGPQLKRSTLHAYTCEKA
jgi:hypothetical protein